MRAAFVAGLLCCVCMGAVYKVVQNLQDLNNVKLPAAPSNGDALVYNTSLGAWTNGTASGGSGIGTSGGLGTNTTIYGLTINTGETNNSLTASRAVVTDANKGVISSSVTATELAYVSGVTGNIQTNLDKRASTNIQVIAGSNVTITTNSVNSWTIASSGGGGSGILTSNGLGTNTTFYATAGTTNRPAIFVSTNTALTSYFDKDANLVIGTNTASLSGVMLKAQLDSYSTPTLVVGSADPAYSDSGLFSGKYHTIGTSLSSVLAYFNANGGAGWTLANTYGFGWNSSAGGTVGTMNSVDTYLSRNAANVVEFSTGSKTLATRSTLLAAKYTGRAGTSTTTYNAGGVIWVDTTTTGNVGSGVDTILTNNIGADVFTVNGDSVDLFITGNIADTVGANKELVLKIAGQTIYDSGVIAPAVAVPWRMQATLTRTGASALDYNVAFIPNDASTTAQYVTVAQGSLTIGLTTNNPVLMTGESSTTPTSNDVVRRIARAEFKPAP